MDPYAASVFTGNPFAAKRAVAGRIVAVLDGSLDKRGLELIKPISRALKAHEIHELIATEEEKAAPGSRVDSISYLAFFEVERGGVVLVGDEVVVEGKSVGRVAGFDDTHMPNHQNIVLRAVKKATGRELGIELENTILFKRE